MSSPADSELITRVLHRDDRAAFSQLVLRHQQNVRALLRKLTCGDLARADDLAQETFIKVYLKLSSFRGGSKLSSWIYRIAYNTFLAHQRRRASRSRFQTESQGEQAWPPEAFRAETSAPNTALSVDLERAMAVLKEPERAALALCYACGLSHSEVADTMDIPLGTVKTHIKRGRDKLRPLLEAWRGTDVDHQRT